MPFLGVDEAIKIWNLKTLELVTVRQDEHQRWGQITALKWVADDCGDSSILLVGTARGRLAIYQWSSLKVRLHQFYTTRI